MKLKITITLFAFCVLTIAAVAQAKIDTTNRQFVSVQCQMQSKDLQDNGYVSQWFFTPLNTWPPGSPPLQGTLEYGSCYFPSYFEVYVLDQYGKLLWQAGKKFTVTFTALPD